MHDAAWPRIVSDPGLAAVYAALLAELERLGPFDVRHRKSAVHFVRPDGAGFAAVHPGPDGLALTLVVNQPLTSPRLVGTQQLSDGIWNQQVVLGSTAALDDEVCRWLATAYRRG